MSLAQLILAVYLILVGIVHLKWVVISPTVLGIFALVSGILLLLEGTATFSYKVGNRE